jgi:hypothetical protein
MKKLILVLFLALTLTFADNPRGGDEDGGGKLDDIEKDIERGEGDYEAIFEILFFLIIHFPDLIFGIGELFFGSLEEEGEYGYSKYPYYYSTDGLYSTSSTFTSAGNIKLSYLHESINLHGYEFHATLYPAKKLSFDIAVKKFGENYGLSSDDLLLADAFVNFQRVRLEHFDLRWGFGAKMFDAENRYFGPAYNLAFDIYGMKPVSINFQYTGALINYSYINDLNVDLNFHNRNLMFFIGYNYFGSNSVSINSFRVGAGINF